MTALLRPRPEQLPLIPANVNIAQAIREGFYQCRQCWSVETVLNPANGERHCSRCKSYSLKYCPGIGD